MQRPFALTVLLATAFGCGAAHDDTATLTAEGPPAEAAALPKRAPKDGLIAAAPASEADGFIARLSAQKGNTEEQTSKVLAAWHAGSGDAIADDVAPLLVFQPLSAHEVFHADIDNDGKLDWILTGMNTVSDHRSWVEGAWTDDGGKLAKLDFDETVSRDLLHGEDLGPHFHGWVGSPFLDVKDGVTTMHFADFFAYDAKGELTGLNHPDAVRRETRDFTYVWKGGHIALREAASR